MWTQHAEPELGNSRAELDDGRTKPGMPRPSSGAGTGLDGSRAKLDDPRAELSFCVKNVFFLCSKRTRTKTENERSLAVSSYLNKNTNETLQRRAVRKSESARITEEQSGRQTFCRTLSSNEVHSSDLRPPPVLRNTLKYLLDLMISSEHPFEIIHDFVFDRTRSIRQDLSIQNIIDEHAIEMYEKMVEFHIISHLKLAKSHSDPDNLSLHYLNMEQLTKCLLSLYEIYDLNRIPEFVIKKENEFHSFYVLHLELSLIQMKIWLTRLSALIVRLSVICFVFRIFIYFRMGNYKRFFAILAMEASQLQLRLIEPFLNEVRVQALSCINHSGYKLQPYPLELLAELLMIKEDELESLCCECGLQIITDELGCKLVPAKQSNFHHPKSDLESYSLTTPVKFHSLDCGDRYLEGVMLEERMMVVAVLMKESIIEFSG
ncbi:hypothetical protein KSP39_PZI008774 [Platanthera zijinensis]|uniref:SAC3/GANP/THP3 conserved domain-containing protein n=1 Tax=Platanthera zijinensis TaxID=2320716 RepID=A0AAP0G7J3_9ASPA